MFTVWALANKGIARNNTPVMAASTDLDREQLSLVMLLEISFFYDRNGTYVTHRTDASYECHYVLPRSRFRNTIDRRGPRPASPGVRLEHLHSLLDGPL